MKKRIILIVSGILIVISIGSIFLINTVFSIVMKHQLKNISIIDDIGASDYLDIYFADDNEYLDEAEQGLENNTTDNNNLSTDNHEDYKKEKDIDEIKPNDNTNSNKADGNTSGIKKQKDNKAQTSLPNVQVGNNKLKDIEKAVSLSDKTKAVSIVFGSLSQGDIAQLTQLASGGLSAQNQAQAKAILSKKLTRQQKDTLKGLYGKYQHLLK